MTYIQSAMTGKGISTRPGLPGITCEEAQSLYLAGRSLEEIRNCLPVSRQALTRWHKEGLWEEKRQLLPVSPRWLGEALRGLLREKTGNLILQRGDLQPAEVDGLIKILTLIEKLGGQGWDFRSAALEVLDRFSDFLRVWVKDLEDLKKFSLWMQEFFRKLEEDGEGQG